LLINNHLHVKFQCHMLVTVRQAIIFDKLKMFYN